MTEDKIKKVTGLLEKAHQHNEKLYNLVGDLIAGREAKKHYGLVEYIREKLGTDPEPPSYRHWESISKYWLCRNLLKLCKHVEETEAEIKRLKKENGNEKCRHKKLILASANYVEFIPDQEPYKDGVIESCGINSILADINILYCPKCNTAEFDGFDNIHAE